MVLIAHYYTDPEIQALAEETGGFVGDSLEMAKFGNRHSASTLIIAGVRFMGESAEDPYARKTHSYADTRSGVFIRSRLPSR